MLLDRVAVEWPYDLERLAFGWMTGGQVPAHWSRSWVAAHAGTIMGDAVSLAAQYIYLSHLFVLPLILLFLWIRGFGNESYRQHFSIYMRCFAVLHALAILIYVLLPVAPPWWVSLNGLAHPTPELVAATNMTAAMDGVIVQGLIRSASNWFAAVPSLHGAYPVLMYLLALRNKNRFAARTFLVYTVAMFASTVALNQHYIFDLLVGSLLSLTAYSLASRVKLRKEDTQNRAWRNSPKPV
jgi:hypothetical protein